VDKEILPENPMEVASDSEDEDSYPEFCTQRTAECEGSPPML